MFLKPAQCFAVTAIAAAIFYTDFFVEENPALAQTLDTGVVTNTLATVENTAASLQNTVPTVPGVTPLNGLNFSDLGGTSLSSGYATTGSFRTDTFFLDDSSFQTIFRDPNSPSYLPVKAGMAVFTTKAGRYRLEFNYGGRFNGDFEEHQAGLKFKGKF